MTLRIVWSTVALYLIASGVGFGADHVLVVGGGPAPANSQISIEKNVLFFRQALELLGRSDLAPFVLFASGPQANPDVCFDGGDAIGKAYRLAGELLGDAKAATQCFRTHDIGPVDGPSDREAILSTLADYAGKLKQGDRLFLYVTGHGGKGDPTTNGFLATWGQGQLHVKSLAETLDKFPPEVEVTVVMVQCYSGCFANILFEGGDPSKPLAPHRRAGFFATVDSRPAAGCTPDTKVENYKEYSTSFYAALCGKDRLGRNAKADDIDKDGSISFAEAHAYTILDAETIDICYRTSDRFLESQARLDPNDPKLLIVEQPLEMLLSLADPVRRHLLEKLAKELRLKPETVVVDGRAKAEEISEQRKKTQEKIHKASKPMQEAAEKIKNDLFLRWPFLRNAWHQETHALLANPDGEFVTFVESHPSYHSWRRGRDRIESLRKLDLQKERQWAKVERFLLSATSVVRAENLKRDGNADLIARYQALLDLENSSLSKPKQPMALAN